MHIEESLALIKPDAVARGLCGEIIRRIEGKGYCIVDMYMVQASRELLAQHYAGHAQQPFFDSLLEFMSSGQLVAIRIGGNRVVEGFRCLIGTTDPTLAPAGTIRGDLGRAWDLAGMRNLVHGSDSPASAQRELSLWFDA